MIVSLMVSRRCFSLFVAVVWVMQAWAVLLMPATAQSLVVSEANCSSAAVAQNASVTLTWELLDGSVNYTRISHCSEALLATATVPSDRLLIIGGIAYESAQPDHIMSAVSAAYLSAAVESVFVSPASRSDHASFINQDGVVYFFGGQSRGFLNDTWRGCVDGSSTNVIWDELVMKTDPATIAAAPVPRIGHSFTKVFENSTMIGAVVFGGLSEDYVELSGLHVAFIPKNTASAVVCSNRGPAVAWRKLQAAPSSDSGAVPLARAYHAAMTSSKLFTSSKLLCLIVHGGKSSQEGVIFNELWRLCPTAATSLPTPVERMNYTWELLTEIGTTPGARYGASVTFVDEGKLALAGGSYTFPSDFLSDTWELNINATQWIRLSFDEDFTPPRRGHTLTFFATTTRLFLFGGRDRYTVVQKRMQAAYYAAPFCAAGLKITFCSKTSQYVCIACPAGSYLASGSRKCLLCPQGTFSSAGSAECTNCPAGTYSTNIGKDSSLPCTSCPVGTYSQAIGAVSSGACAVCAAGTFAASTGSVSCSTCVAGTFSNANSSSCTLCPSGQWSSPGAGVCTNCSAGTYTPSIGSSACFSCPRGFFSNAGSVNCSACPMNTYSASIRASASACTACPALGFTTCTGRTTCDVCPFGATWNGSVCVPCSKGFYASSTTGGACLSCPRGSYASASGSTVCQSCPTGTFTSSTGTTNSSDCQLCPSGSFFNGVICQSCSVGTYPEPSGFCSLCVPGSYFPGGLTGVLDTSLGCDSCPSMSYSSGLGATGCLNCADNSFSMEAWRNCISCDTQMATLPGCMTGRNSLLCSGNGACVYGGCACSSSWVGSDCSVFVGNTTNLAAPAVLYFLAAPLQIVNASTSSSVTDIEIVVGRSGYPQSRLQATVSWGSNNFSNSPSALPVSLDFQSGESVKSFRIPVAQLSPRSGCRYFTLQLADLPGASISAISSNSDAQLIVYVDDVNGVSGGVAGKSIASTYTRQSNGMAFATATLDRLVATQASLMPQTAIVGANVGVALRDLPLNLMVALDFSISSAHKIVDLLPAIIAELQSVYQTIPDGVRMGLMNSTSATFYSNLADFLSASEALVATNTSLDWPTVANELVASSALWPSNDRRHLLVIASDRLISSSLSADLTSALRAQSTFAFTLSPTQATFTGASDIMRSVAHGGLMATIPSKLRQAFQQKDAEVPASVIVLSDPAGLVTSAQVTDFSSGPGTLPIVSINIGPDPTPAQLRTITSMTITVSIPGNVVLSILVQEPGSACFPPAQTAPMDILSLSGWADAWHLSTLSSIKQLWKPSSRTLTMALHQTTSLLRTWNSTVLSVNDSASPRVELSRTFPGSFFATGLSLATRGYWRVKSSAAICNIQLTMIGSNTSLKEVHVVPFASTVIAKEWNYGYLQSLVPWELSNLTLSLRCNTTSPGVIVEWASLGLLPDPAFACKCPRGFYHDILNSNSSSRSDGNCVRCAAGSYCVAGIKRQCPDGTFSFGKAPSCEECRDGWLCTDGLARLCDPGTYATPSFTCGICPSGYACRNGKKTICPAGMFSLQRSSNCQSCPPGTISRSEGSSTCELCPLGYTSNYQRDHCITCSPGEATLRIGQHPCSSCLATAFPIRNQPEVCLA